MVERSDLLGDGINLFLDEANKNNMDIIIPWSGGLDSTCLLHYVATHYTGSGNIIAFSIEHKQIPQWKTEVRVRTNLKKLFEKEGLKINYRIAKMEVDNGPVNNGGRCRGIQQAPNFLGALSCLLAYKNTAVLWGCVNGDDFNFYHEKFKVAFNALAYIVGGEAKLHYPLIWVRKIELIEYVKHTNLIDHIWCCEEIERVEPCGKCNSCVRHEEALRGWEYWYNTKPQKASNIDDIEVEYYDEEEEEYCCSKEETMFNDTLVSENNLEVVEVLNSKNSCYYPENLGSASIIHDEAPEEALVVDGVLV